MLVIGGQSTQRGALLAVVVAAVAVVSVLPGATASALPSVPRGNGLVVAETRRGFVLMNAADNSLVTRIPGTGPLDHSPAFSPSGRRIAYSSLRQGDSEI
jgi:hypothetical protein